MTESSDSVQIRPADLHDAGQLADLHLLVWEQAYAGQMSAETFAERAREPHPLRVARWSNRIESNRVTVAVRAGRLVGWSEFGLSRDEDLVGESELYSLYVEAADYGTGLGHKLFTAPLPTGPVSLWVLAGNERAIRFYLRQGSSSMVVRSSTRML